MKHSHPLVVYFLLLLVAACTQKNKFQSSVSPFGNLDEYFIDQIASLEKTNAGLVKTLDTGGKIEKSVDNNPDWKTELTPFTEAVAGKPALINAYFADSVLQDEKLKVIFTARDQAPEIKKVVIYSKNGINDSIQIVRNIKNMYYSAVDTLVYRGNGNYFIKSQNTPAVGKINSFILTGNIKPD